MAKVKRKRAAPSSSAQRGCKYFSLACSCQNLGINFFDYFLDILGKCAAMPNGAPPEAYRNLLPDRWAKE